VVEAARNWDLSSAEQRDVIPAKLACGKGGMLGIQIFSNGEEGAGYIVDIKLIPLEYSGEQLACRIQNLLTRISGDGSSAP